MPYVYLTFDLGLTPADPVYAVSVAEPPEIVRGLTDVAGEEGRTVSFQCEITGNPKPEIRWYKGAREIVDGGKYSFFASGNNYELRIHDLFGEDADEYSCRATNVAGAKSTRGEVFIKCKSSDSFHFFII